MPVTCVQAPSVMRHGASAPSTRPLTAQMASAPLAAVAVPEELVSGSGADILAVLDPLR